MMICIFYRLLLCGLGVQLILLISFPLPQPALFSMAAPLLLPPVVKPILRCRSCLPAGVKVSARGVLGGSIFPGVCSPRTDLCVLSAADLSAALTPGLGVYPFARSFIDLLALSPSFLPISSRRLVSGILNDGPSSGSSPPSSALGVDISVPHVNNDGRS